MEAPRPTIDDFLDPAVPAALGELGCLPHYLLLRVLVSLCKYDVLFLCM